MHLNPGDKKNESKMQQTAVIQLAESSKSEKTFFLE